MSHPVPHQCHHQGPFANSSQHQIQTAPSNAEAETDRRHTIAVAVDHTPLGGSQSVRSMRYVASTPDATPLGKSSVGSHDSHLCHADASIRLQSSRTTCEGPSVNHTSLDTANRNEAFLSRSVILSPTTLSMQFRADADTNATDRISTHGQNPPHTSTIRYAQLQSSGSKSPYNKISLREEELLATYPPLPPPPHGSERLHQIKNAQTHGHSNPSPNLVPNPVLTPPFVDTQADAMASSMSSLLGLPCPGAEEAGSPLLVEEARDKAEYSIPVRWERQLVVECNSGETKKETKREGKKAKIIGEYGERNCGCEDSKVEGTERGSSSSASKRQTMHWGNESVTSTATNSTSTDTERNTNTNTCTCNNSIHSISSPFSSFPSSSPSTSFCGSELRTFPGRVSFDVTSENSPKNVHFIPPEGIEWYIMSVSMIIVTALASAAGWTTWVEWRL